MPSPAEEDLPVADPIPQAHPIPVEPSRNPSSDLPIAEPIRSNSPPARPKRPAERRDSSRDAGKEPRPISGDAPPPRPRYFTACCVIGCLGGSAAAGVVFLLIVAIVVLGQFSKPMVPDQPADSPLMSRGPRPGPIRPTQLANPRATVNLPGPVTGVALGGNGRYLLMRVPGQIAVFDPNAGELLQPFFFAGPDVSLMFAASSGHLFVHRSGRIERYNLESRQLEAASAPLNQPGIVAMTCGPENDGPLVLFCQRNDDLQVSFFDPERMVDTEVKKLLPRTRISPNLGAAIRVSGDGRTIGLAGERRGRGGIILPITANGSFSEPITLEGSPFLGHVSPSPRGQSIYTSQGVFDATGQAMIAPAKGAMYTFPASHGNDFFLSADATNFGLLRGKLRLHLSGVAQPVGELTSINIPVGLSINDTEMIPADQRIYFWPAAGLVAVLSPLTNTTLELYKIDPGELLQSWAQPYVAFDTHPLGVAQRGQPYRYRFSVWSSDQESVQFELKQQPPGMRLNHNEITWTPTTTTPDRVEVELVARLGTITSSQHFRIVVTDP